MAGVDSIQKEIDLHRGAMPEAQWLTAKGLINDIASPYTYELNKDWYMPGYESYILDFTVNSHTRAQRLIAKACIKMSGTLAVEEWHRRRQRVQTAGIQVPTLYSTHKADYIEEYIAMDLKAAHTAASPETRYKLESNFLETYRKLGALGFVATSLHDVRSRGEDVVLIDFGSDLGGYTETPRLDTSVDKKAETELRRILR